MKRNKSLIWKFALLFFSLVVLVAALATPTIARYVINADNDAEGEFLPPPPDKPTARNAVFANGKMEKVYIQVEETTYPVYVRVEIIISWKTEDGEVYYQPPVSSADNDEEYDYEIVFNSVNWTKSTDGFYYYHLPVESGKATGTLVESLTLSAELNPPSGYSFNVEFLAQSVQAIGDNGTQSALEDAWTAYPNSVVPPNLQS